MKNEKIIKLMLEKVKRQHILAKAGFKDYYSFDVKHRDLLFDHEWTLDKLQGAQEADKRKLITLEKAIAKRQPDIDRMLLELEVINGFKESDIAEMPLE